MWEMQKYLFKKKEKFIQSWIVREKTKTTKNKKTKKKINLTLPH